jgi:hypothetical protein
VRELLCAVEQGDEQPPQSIELWADSTSQPVTATPSQSEKPALQDAILQKPFAHADIAFGAEHALLQYPQCATVLIRSVSQPLAELLSQSPCPAAQPSATHAPFLQLQPGDGHTFPQLPQFIGSFGELDSQPLARSPSQFW